MITCNQKALSKLRKESRPFSARWRCNTCARRWDETSIGTSVSPRPARSHTITASSKASATATRNPPPHPAPYKTGPKLAMRRRRGHHTGHYKTGPSDKTQETKFYVVNEKGGSGASFAGESWWRAKGGAVEGPGTMMGLSGVFCQPDRNPAHVLSPLPSRISVRPPVAIRVIVGPGF